LGNVLGRGAAPGQAQREGDQAPEVASVEHLETLPEQKPDRFGTVSLHRDTSSHRSPGLQRSSHALDTHNGARKV
jgi:hypothetical protein